MDKKFLFNENSFALENDFSQVAVNLSKILDIRKKEAMVYLILYRLGDQTPNILGKHMNINRTTMTSILESLREKHLVKKHPGDKGLTYSALPLDELEQSFQLKVHLIQEKQNILSLYRPTIEKLKPNMDFAKALPKITYYQGLEQAKQAMIKIIQSVPENSEILTYVNVAKRDEPEYQEFWPLYYKIRKERKIYMKQISPDTPTCKLHTSKDKEELRETRLIPFKDFPFPPNFEITIFPKSFVTLNLDPTCSMVTTYEDELAFEAFKAIFEHHWELLNQARKKNTGHKNFSK